MTPVATQLELAPAVRSSRTSLAASRQIESNAGTLRRRVLDYLRLCSCGATDEEIQDSLNMNPSTQRPRRVELVKAGLVHDSRRTKQTKAGRQAVVWEALP